MTLDRDKARPIVDEALHRAAMDLPVTADSVLNRLVECVPDHPEVERLAAVGAGYQEEADRLRWRLARIAALCDQPWIDSPVGGAVLRDQVRAVLAGVEPSVTIDRDTLEKLLEQFELIGPHTPDAQADAILALLRPVEGVTSGAETEATP